MDLNSIVLAMLPFSAAACFGQSLTTAGLPEASVILYSASSAEAQALLRKDASFSNALAASGQDLSQKVVLVNKSSKLIVGYTLE